MPNTTKDGKPLQDELTGLGSYHAFTPRIEKELARAEEQNNTLSIAVVDIDFFKKVNDQHGHVVGDEIIRVLGQHLAKAVTGRGEVFRCGGEEFSILFPGTEKEQAFLILERARESFDREHGIETGKGKVKIKLAFSAGLASFPEDGARAKDVLRKADGACYRAKNSGRNKICLAKEEKMTAKTSHYTIEQLGRLSDLAKQEEVGEAVLLREALDDLFKKYGDQQAASAHLSM